MPRDRASRDVDDVKEDASWSCSVCGAGGTCVKGDEGIALLVHQSLAHGRGD